MSDLLTRCLTHAIKPPQKYKSKRSGFINWKTSGAGPRTIVTSQWFMVGGIVGRKITMLTRWRGLVAAVGPGDILRERWRDHVLETCRCSGKHSPYRPGGTGARALYLERSLLARSRRICEACENLALYCPLPKIHLKCHKHAKITYMNTFAFQGGKSWWIWQVKKGDTRMWMDRDRRLVGHDTRVFLMSSVTFLSSQESVAF